MTKIFMLAVALSTSIVVGTSGCGSSNSKPLTRAELTRKANAICRRIIAEVDWDKVNPRVLPRVVDRLAALEEQAARELNELTPPPAMADEFRLIIDGFKLTGPEFKEIAREASTSAETGGYVLPLSNAQHERGLEATYAGLKECTKY